MFILLINTSYFDNISNIDASVAMTKDMIGMGFLR